MIKHFCILFMSMFSLIFSYNVGDYVNMVDQEKEFDVCYGSTDEYLELSISSLNSEVGKEMSNPGA